MLRVPAGAVFGIDGSSGCIVPKSHNASNTPAKVTIVGSELGVSLVQTQDADVSAIANVENRQRAQRAGLQIVGG